VDAEVAAGPFTQRDSVAVGWICGNDRAAITRRVRHLYGGIAELALTWAMVLTAPSRMEIAGSIGRMTQRRVQKHLEPPDRSAQTNDGLDGFDSQ
jgi:hypothetical protein